MATDETPFPISLAPRHWIVILGALELINEKSMQIIDDIRKQGVDPKSLSEAGTTALVGPALVRGIIVKELAARGFMTAEANERFGIDKILEGVRR
jgi:hypothetical protein